MDIFSYAMKLEEEGIKLYSEALSMTANTDLQNILIMLIDQEKRHKALFEYMKDSSEVDVSIQKYECARYSF